MDTIQQIKKIYSIIQAAEDNGLSNLKIDAKGQYVAPCPFHEETKPSFRIYPDSGTYFCFGCKETGDVINLVAKLRGLTITETVAYLAQNLGIARQQAPAQNAPSDFQRYIQVCSALSQQYETTFWGPQSKALEYCKSRGLGEAVLRQFRIGNCPPSHDFQGLLKKHMVSEKEALTWGLLARSEKNQRLYDPNWGRLTFPVTRGMQHEVIAFGARALGESHAKYINSSKNPFYQKGRELYALDYASSAALKSKRMLLVEGYMDVLSMHQAGYTETVGILGTALTPEQLKMLSKYTSYLLFLYDNDIAGQNAARISIRLSTQFGFNTGIVFFPEGEDPSSYLQQIQGNRLLFDSILGSVQDGLQYLLTWGEENLSPMEFSTWLSSYLRDVPEDFVRCILVKKVADFLGAPVSAFWKKELIFN